MTNSIIISAKVVSKIKQLSTVDGQAISSALASEFILGKDPMANLNPLQSMIYIMIRSNVMYDINHIKASS